MNSREKEILEAIRTVCKKHANRLLGRIVYLIGSRARGNENRTSDFDIAVKGEQPMPLKDFYAIEDDFDNMRTLYQIDWLDLCKTDHQFSVEALKSAQIIYDGRERN